MGHRKTGGYGGVTMLAKCRLFQTESNEVTISRQIFESEGFLEILDMNRLHSGQE